nr:ROK family protein [Bacilli bacterium]
RFDEICHIYNTKITSDIEESYFYVKKIILTLIWMVGGNEIVIEGDKGFFDYILAHKDNDPELINSEKGMEEVFKTPFVFSYSDKPLSEKELIIPVSGDFKGQRIGFDAGGSDRKVSAVKDGEVVFSEEVLWLPKEQTDWHYHYDGILDSMKRAAAHLDRVDAIGVSTAGIVMNDEVAQSNLFIKVPANETKEHVRSIFKDIAIKEFGCVPIKVSNDGDVTALGGEMLYGKDHLLGIAMGTSEAAGYSLNHSFNGWINELGKVPMNYSENAASHYATGIKGAGSEYLSQKGIIRLAKLAGYEFEGTLAEQLVAIQKADDGCLDMAYEDIGTYLGDVIALYSKFLDIKSVLLLGRVMSGRGGDVLIERAKETLKRCGKDIEILSADENFKRLGQSYIAASLPKQ